MTAWLTFHVSTSILELLAPFIQGFRIEEYLENWKEWSTLKARWPTCTCTWTEKRLVLGAILAKGLIQRAVGSDHEMIGM